MSSEVKGKSPAEAGAKLAKAMWGIDLLRAQPPAREDARPWGYGFRRKSWGDAWSFSRSKEQADDILGYSDGEVQPLYTHPAPDALRAVTPELAAEFANIDGPWTRGQMEMEEVWSRLIDAQLAALQAEQKGGAA